MAVNDVAEGSGEEGTGEEDNWVVLCDGKLLREVVVEVKIEDEEELVIFILVGRLLSPEPSS